MCCLSVNNKQLLILLDNFTKKIITFLKNERFQLEFNDIWVRYIISDDKLKEALLPLFSCTQRKYNNDFENDLKFKRNFKIKITLRIINYNIKYNTQNSFTAKRSKMHNTYKGINLFHFILKILLLEYSVNFFNIFFYLEISY